MCGLMSILKTSRSRVLVDSIVEKYKMVLLFSCPLSCVYRDVANKYILKVFKQECYSEEKFFLKTLHDNQKIRPHIPSIVEFNDTGQYILMEHRGIDGIELINSGQYTPELWSEYLDQCIPIVNEIIDMGYVHRDIKPENAVYDKKTGLWSFIDFGFMGPAKMSKSTFKGTLPYTIPLMGNREMLERFKIHNDPSDARIANDYFAFALSALSLKGHDHIKTARGIELNLVPIYALIMSPDQVMQHLARVVVACVNTDYCVVNWVSAGQCTFIHRVAINWDNYSLDMNVKRCWAKLVQATIIEKQKREATPKHVQIENHPEQSDQRKRPSEKSRTGVIVL